MPVEKRVPPKNPKKDVVAKETAERTETKAKAAAEPKEAKAKKGAKK